MQRLAVGLTMVAALGMTGTAVARGNPALKAARDACRTERQQIGGKAFRQKYGPHSMTACIAQHGVTVPPAHHRHGDKGNHPRRGRHGNDQGNQGGNGDNQGNGGSHGNGGND